MLEIKKNCQACWTFYFFVSTEGRQMVEEKEGKLLSKELGSGLWQGQL